jgi:perosamine synthetase
VNSSQTPDGYRTIPFGRPSIGEAERHAVLEVLESPILTHGPRMEGFEKDFAAFTEAPHSLAFSSGMAALHASLVALGAGPGDDVLVPAMTHTATVHAVEMVGARPVFVDCRIEDGNLTAEALEAAKTPNTRGIMLVHYVGIACPMRAIMDFAQNHGLFVVEDCALAPGTRYEGKHVGLWGDAGCFSFYPVKHMTTGEGGMLITRHEELAAKAKAFRGFGVTRTHSERSIPGIYDVTSLGVNYRMSELNAALGIVQTARMPEFLEARARNFFELATGLRSIPGLRILDAADAHAGNSHYCLVAVLPESKRHRRNELVLDLKQRSIGTSVYYPHPIPRLTYYQEKYRLDWHNFPNAATISDHAIALPVGPHLAPGDGAFIVEQFTQSLNTL